MLPQHRMRISSRPLPDYAVRLFRTELVRRNSGSSVSATRRLAKAVNVDARPDRRPHALPPRTPDRRATRNTFECLPGRYSAVVSTACGSQLADPRLKFAVLTTASYRPGWIRTRSKARRWESSFWVPALGRSQIVAWSPRTRTIQCTLTGRIAGAQRPAGDWVSYADSSECEALP